MKLRILLTAILLAGCGKDGPETQPAPGPGPDGGQVTYTLSEGTVDMDQATAANVTNVEEDAITFAGGTPAASIPQVGQILLSSITTERMPNGFLGRVTAVESQGGQTVVRTEPVPLDEAFEELDIDQSLDLGQYITEVLDPDGNPMSFAKSRYPAGTTRGAPNEVFIEIPFKKEFKEGDLTIGAELKFKFSLKLDFNMKINIATLQYLNVAVNPRLEVTGEVKAALEGKIKKDIQLCTVSCGKITMGPVIIVPKVILYYTTGAEGEISLVSTLSFVLGASYGIRYENQEWSEYSQAGTSDPNDEVFKKVSEFNVKGKIYHGVKVSMLFSLYGLNAGLGLSATPKLVTGAQFKIDAANLSTGECYKDLKDTKLSTGMALAGDAYVMAKLFKNKLAKHSFYTPEVEFPPFMSKHLLPHFADYDIETDKETYATLSVWMGNETFFPVDVGVALYDNETGARLQTQYASNKHMDDLKNPYLVTFRGLDSETEYMVKPACKLFGVEFIGDVSDSGSIDEEDMGEYFPDPVLRGVVRGVADINKDYRISRKESEAVTALYIDHIDVTSLEGLQHLKNLQTLAIGSNTQLTSIYLGSLQELRMLSIDNYIRGTFIRGKLASLNIGGCTKLESLTVRGSSITSLDLRGKPQLDYLNLYYNKLAGIDVSSCPRLRIFLCSNNNITQQIPSWFSQLEYFDYDRRYEYYTDADNVRKHTDHGKGWWYIGEPSIEPPY